ncbi:MAG: [Fe-Fe] hydrogenase large subunit C-terminal domain-containing protein, partial [Sutterella sp.]|nr:[Fe-Fe] hydrogenase large subunit C-terminal domain-containing protein [Sutterella sp.]
MLAYINDRPVEFNEGETILAAAKRAGIFIPTLCALLPLDHTPGTCRVCLVEIRDGASSRITTACTTPIAEGMHVYTRTDTVRAMQKQQVKWLFSDHDQNCAACPRHGDCELQDAAVYVGLTQNPDNGNRKAPRPFDDSATALVRDANKCIRCMRCVEVCRKVQGLSALTLEGFGTRAGVGIAGTDKWGQSSRCVQCGQCTLVCPVGALAEKDQLDTALAWFNNPEIKTVVAFAPAVRVTLGEAFGMPLGENSEKRIVTALKQIGADFVCDINWAADVTIMEEGTELIDRIEHGGKLPMMTSCCPGWINFVEKVNPEVIENLSTTRSPQGIFGALAKTYFAKKKDVNPKKLRFISVMPCTAKKDEAVREQ